MVSKVFLDANILLNLTLQREFYTEAKQLFELAVEYRIKAFVTPSIVHSVGYWMTKAYGERKAKQWLLTLLTDISVIDIPHQVVLTALHSKMDDIEDALQYYSAVHHHIDYFVSRDKRLKEDSMPVLPVYTPAEFIAIFY